MRNIGTGLKMITCCVLVALGALVLPGFLVVLAILLMAGPLLALAGLLMGMCLFGSVAAIVFAGPPTAMSGGLAVSAVIRDLTS